MSAGNFRDDQFVYAAYVPSIAAGASATSIIQIEANSDFIWEKTTYMADIAGAAQTDSSRVIPLITMAVTDSGSGRNLQNIALPVPSAAGDGTLPFVIPVARPFRANSNISLTFTNYSAATTYANLYVCFVGYKRFKMG